MLAYKILGIVLAVVVVGSTVIIYLLKQNILQLQSLFRWKKTKKYSNNLLEIKEIINSFGGIKNILQIKKKTTTEIAITVKNKKGLVAVSNQQNSFSLTKINGYEYHLAFNQEKEADDVYSKIALILQ